MVQIFPGPSAPVGLIHGPGRYYDCAGIVGAFSAPAGLAVSADTLYCQPFQAIGPKGYDRLALKLTLAGAGGTLGRMSVLTTGTDGLPDALLADSGTFAVDDALEHLVTVSVPTIFGQVYWTAFQSNGTPTVLRYNANSNNEAMGWPTGSATSREYHVQVARSFAAIAATLTGTSWTYSNAPIAVRLRAI